MWHGQLSPRFKFNKLKSFSGVEIDQNHVDKRILRGKGFAVGRVKRHNFCPASALRNRCCIDTKRCKHKVTLRYGTGVALTLSAVQVDILSHRCCVCIDTKRDHGGQENNTRLSGI